MSPLPLRAPAPPAATRRPRLDHATVWRWHFYAGLLCVPFVIWLALTGTLYLWRPQIETWLDRPYDHLAMAGPAAAPEAQVAAALRAVPGATLHRYVLPERPDAAVRILVTQGGADRRVYVHPRTLAVLGNVVEERRPMRLLAHLHGELLAGAWGSYLVEVAACWAIVMLLTGLWLWWPRGARGLGGVLYPRLTRGGRLFWRDLHAVAGLWVSLLALGLILTGLPWANGWGGYLAEVRQLTGTARGPVDWTIGGKPPATDAMPGEHAGHGGMAPSAPPPLRPGELTRVIAAVRPLGVAAPVLIAPPPRAGAPWSISSDAADRPLRSDAQVDGATGRVIGRINFADRHWIDRAVGYGVAAHEGALFGLANQLLGTATALLLVVLAVSGTVLWWRQRPSGRLGAPVARAQLRFGAGLVAAVVALALYLPLFGLTLLMVLAAEALVRRWAPDAAGWIGLRPA